MYQFPQGHTRPYKCGQKLQLSQLGSQGQNRHIKELGMHEYCKEACLLLGLASWVEGLGWRLTAEGPLRLVLAGLKIWNGADRAS